LLHSAGVFPPHAPATIRTFLTRGQHEVGQLIDRYGIECGPIRDLLVDYLRERRPRLDYVTLSGLSRTLGKVFWRDLEQHHPGIDSLRLDPQVAAGWKQRLLTKATRGAANTPTDGSAARIGANSTLATVRSFYLDLGEWAIEEPSRWGPWVAPSPIRATEISHTKDQVRRKSRMDQRTRQRIPALPALVAQVTAERAAARERLDQAAATRPGELFTAGGTTLRRSTIVKGVSVRTWAQDPDTGVRRDLTLEEHQGFWAWACIEVLRHSGIRIEELTELSHHSLVQYQLPGTGELIPLLHVTPSKTDTERLLVISPELADVLSAVICRVRDETGAVPLVASYGEYERLWNPPMPLLFQRWFGTEYRPIPAQAIRKLINTGATRGGITDADGRALAFSPHDFRRIFVTDAVMHGMPPHIAQLVVGHKNINTTMGYEAVYPEEVITGHRAFIARRRALRPGEEYRTPTDAEWEEFLGHFEHRKLSLGTCGRTYGTPCIHEHSCLTELIMGIEDWLPAA
jgi:integrase